MGVSANFLTFLGLSLAFATAFLIYIGSLWWAGAFLLLSGLADLLDGAVARASRAASRFGGILDSSLDRYGDGAVFAALVFYFLQHQKNLLAIFAMSALIGSFLVSYVRARAEREMENCRVGFWERGERVVYLALGLILNNLTVSVLVLGIGTHCTAIRRLWVARAGGLTAAQKNSSRNTALYSIQCFALLSVLFLKKT